MRLFSRHGLLLSLFFLVLCSHQAFAAPPEALRFAPLPMVSENNLRNDFKSFAVHLGQVVNKPVNLVLKKSYRKLLSDFLTDQIDLAFLGPLPYVLLTDRNPDFVPVVRFVDKNGQANYTCCLAAYTGDQINLDTKRPLLVSLTQPYSTCGYLMSEILLNAHGYSLDEGSYIYSGNHSESALDALRGTTQVAGLKTSIAHKYHHLGLEILDESIPVPGFVLVANPRTMAKEDIEKIRADLLKLNPQQNPDDAQMMQLWGEAVRYGATEAHKGDYQAIRTLLQTITIPGIEQ